MAYFKIIDNNKVINVGCVFLKWNANKNRLFVCNFNEGQLVQTYDEKNIYRDEWMKALPKEAGEYPLAKVVMIDEKEYDELKALIDGNETIPVGLAEPSVEKSVIQPETQEEEKPMSIQEMREIILQQQKTIDALIKKTKLKT